MHTKPLIFTDMDGTLLDHHTYSFAAVAPLLKELSAANIAVIPNTSKTYDELLELRKQIKLSGPFIIENGAAICVPEDYFERPPEGAISESGMLLYPLTKPRVHWLSVLEQLKIEFAGCFDHFYQMETKQICEATGLSPEQAKLAASRRFGEPVMWLADEASKQAFIQVAQELGATPLQGGRFIHICGECDKGAAMCKLTQLFEDVSPNTNFTTIALGDSQNDAAMLDAADIAVRIKSPTHAYPQLSRTSKVYDSESYGPRGWTEVMSKLLKQLS